MAHPAAGGAVATNVTETALVTAIRRTKADFFDGLVDKETFGVLIHNTESISTHVQLTANRSAS